MNSQNAVEAMVAQDAQEARPEFDHHPARLWLLYWRKPELMRSLWFRLSAAAALFVSLGAHLRLVLAGAPV